MRYRRSIAVASWALCFLPLARPAAGGEEPRSASLSVAPVGAAPGAAPAATTATNKSPGEAAPLGKPKFALKNSAAAAGGAGAAAADRAAEAKRLIDGYHGLALQYAYKLTRARTAEEKAAIVAKHEPSEKTVRPFARLLAELAAVEPRDEPALDALLFLVKYAGLPEIDAILANTPVAAGDYSAPQLQPLGLVLEFHADNPRLAGVVKEFPPAPDTDAFLLALFQKTHSPQNRAAAGMRLIPVLQQAQRGEQAEAVAAAMAEDRYLEGVPITARPKGPHARDWAQGKLHELRRLAVGQTLPDVGGTTLDGRAAHIADYRGKVVVLSVWTTWCGPCRAAIPHEAALAERLRDQPFALLSVNCDAEQETLAKFLETTPMPWDHWWVGMDGEFSKALSISAFPTVFVLDAEGVIRGKNVAGADLDQAVDALLAELEAGGEPAN
jgi:thiol-disulfide isomerase/thioredoxin